MNPQENLDEGTLPREGQAGCPSSQSSCEAEPEPEAQPSASRVHALNHCMTRLPPERERWSLWSTRVQDGTHVLPLVARVAWTHLDLLSVPKRQCSGTELREGKKEGRKEGREGGREGGRKESDSHHSYPSKEEDGSG